MKTVKQILQEKSATAIRMRRIFAYHYDQMQRELSAEIFNTPTDYQDNSDANILHDHLVSYMEETMQWPSADNQDRFNNQIINNI